MPSGTFERFSRLRTFSGGPWRVDPGSETLENVILVLHGRMTAEFDTLTTFIYLDGDYTTPIGINDLPLGFRVTAAQIDLGLVMGASSAIVNCLAYITTKNYVEPPDSGFLVTPIIPKPSNAALFSIATLTIDGTSGLAGAAVTVVTGVGPILGLEEFGISGTYDTYGFTYDITPADGSSVNINDVIVIKSVITGGPGDLGLDLSQVSISMACGTVVPIIQSPELFVFKIPVTCKNAGASAVIATGNGVQFSGTITLGTLTILNTNASGLYTLVKNKTSDTLYNNARDGSTRDTMVPTPFVKTGFIGG